MKTTEYIIIRDFRAPELDLYARLSETELLRLHEPERGVFIAESPKVIERALQAGCVPISVLCEERHAEEAGMLLGKYGEIQEAEGLSFDDRRIPIYTAPFDVLTRLVPETYIVGDCGDGAKSIGNANYTAFHQLVEV